MEQDAYYGRQVGVVAPLLRARLGFVYDAVLARLSAHLNETVAWKADCGVPGLHIYPVGLAAETGANIQEMYTPPHTDGLHTGKRWPPWVEVNALPHYTISATVAVQLPAKVNATGLLSVVPSMSPWAQFCGHFYSFVQYMYAPPRRALYVSFYSDYLHYRNGQGRVKN